MDVFVRADFTQMTNIYDWIEEKTNIRLNLITYTEDDQISLMFASADYPDFAIRINASDLQRQNAVDAGDLVPLDDLIDQYCPTWKAFFEEYELTDKLTQIEGERFTLPCRTSPRTIASSETCRSYMSRG